MSEPSAASAALPPPVSGEGWTRKKFIFLIALAFAIHVVLIVFATKQQSISHVTAPVPHLKLAENSDEFIALGDPSLFARPNAHDFVSAFWRRPGPLQQPDFNWTEAPRYLSPVPSALGAAFRDFMQTNPSPEPPLNFKPAPKMSAPVAVIDDAMPQATTMQITGELAHRPLLKSAALPSPPWNDVIAPTTVQALVDTAGNVQSAVVLPPDSVFDGAGNAEIGGSNALALVRSFRFAPASKLMLGEIIFTWHTVPLAATNAP